MYPSSLGGSNILVKQMILHSNMHSGLSEKSKTTICGAISLPFHPKLLTAPVAVTHLGNKIWNSSTIPNLLSDICPSQMHSEKDDHLFFRSS